MKQRALMLNHLACIMDGNRRWATQQGLSSLFGHKKGLDTIHLVIDFCLEYKISYLSLYTYSTENLKNRSCMEQDYLFGVLAQEAAQDLDEFKRKKLRMRFIGDRDLFPQSIRSLCEKIEKETVDGTALEVNFLLCYGGRQEIVDTTKRIAKKIASGELTENEITPEFFENNLWTAGSPSPGLIIRTGAQRRLSNFLSYQSAYSELYFLDCMWPNISHQDLQAALIYYDRSKKNFGS